MKKCPYCAEEIQDEAIYCRYCSHDLRAPVPPIPSPSQPRAAESTPVESVRQEVRPRRNDRQFHVWYSLAIGLLLATMAAIPPLIEMVRMSEAGYEDALLFRSQWGNLVMHFITNLALWSWVISLVVVLVRLARGRTKELSSTKGHVVLLWLGPVLGLALFLFTVIGGMVSTPSSSGGEVAPTAVKLPAWDLPATTNASSARPAPSQAHPSTDVTPNLALRVPSYRTEAQIAPDSCQTNRYTNYGAKGRKLCVYGMVEETFSERDYYAIYFQHSSDWFYMYSKDAYWNLKKGDCVKGIGVIEQIGHSAAIDLHKELYWCSSSEIERLAN